MALSGTVWPVHLKPQPDELLSSWMVRQAKALHLKPHTFSSIVWPGRQIWNRDIDKLADVEFVRELAEHTGVSLEMAGKTLLSEYEGKVYKKHNANGNTKWILPLGVYHRKHLNYGLQYCASCLREDKEPYFRRYWRLAFMTECPIHRVTLLERCCDCEMPVNFHRNSSNQLTLANCYNCGSNLKAQAHFQKKSSVVYADFQFKLLEAANNRIVDFYETGVLYPILFFDVLHQLMKVVLYLNEELYRNIPGNLSKSFFSLFRDKRIANIEKFSIDERKVILQIVWWLLQKWPKRYIDLCNKTKIYKSSLYKDMSYIPFWYFCAINKQLVVY